MARRKTLPESVRAKLALAERLANLRSELFGERGGPEMARRLGIPVRTWYNYEAGVTVPAEVILKIIELTSIEPSWLLHGKGSKFRQGAPERRESPSNPALTVGALLREALQLLEGQISADRRPSAADDEAITRPPTAHDESAPGDDIPADAGGDRNAENGADSRSTRGTDPGSAARSEWLAARREGRCIDIVGDAMAPVVADGASVAYSAQEETADQLHNKLVVVWHEGQPMVRWFQNCGRYALLRAENPDTNPPQILIDFEDHEHPARFRRVLWINTPH
jgi:phage repressor protein C with HTH and peptisase S24 domain